MEGRSRLIASVALSVALSVATSLGASSETWLARRLGTRSAAVLAPDPAPRVLALTPAAAQGTVCLPSNTVDVIGQLFDTEPAGIVGADYQRATAMPDGRVLWTFQDGAVRVGPDRIEIVHSIGAVQDGRCFTFLYAGSRTSPRPYLFADATVPYDEWYWPLDAQVGDDGRVYVFVAQMREEGDRYLSRAVPVATRLAVLDGATLLPVDQRSAPDSSAALYGFSVTSDDEWTYLYAQCHRQFGFDIVVGVASHDLSCAPRVTVARVPKGRVVDQPAYWDGATWQPDAARAVPVVPADGRIANATQVEWTGASFVAVNKIDDWWGHAVIFSRSVGPTGPFVQFAAVPEPLKCAVDCNTFFASWLPRAAADRPANTYAWMISHNRWDGVVSAYYRPSAHTVPAVSFLPGAVVYPVDVPAGGVPVMTVTAVAPTGAGHVTVFPCDRPQPNTSNVNYAAGATTANLAVVRPDGVGRICVVSHATTDLVVDVAGVLGPGFVAREVPERVVDTRIGLGGPRARLTPGVPFAVTIGGGGVPVLNVTAVAPASAGHLTVFPCDRPVPDASNVNFAAGETVANLVMVRPDAAGRVCVVSHATTDLVVDVTGAIVDGFAAADTPVRLVDTREGGLDGRLAGGEITEIVLPDAVPSGGAPVLNVTAVAPSMAGHLTVFPCDRPVPEASNVNYAAGETVANVAIVRPDAAGRVCVATHAPTDLVVDLTGAFVGGFEPLDAPLRLVDSRLDSLP